MLLETVGLEIAKGALSGMAAFALDKLMNKTANYRLVHDNAPEAAVAPVADQPTM